MINVFRYRDYREILRSCLSESRARNASYSQAAFARDIGILPSKLSEVLNGHEGISRERAKEISKALKFESSETDYFCDLVQAQHARSSRKKLEAKDRLDKRYKSKGTHKLQEDRFTLIADWVHFAILEAAKLPRYAGKNSFLAETLGVSESVVKKSVDLVVKIGLAKVVNGRVISKEFSTLSSFNAPSNAVKIFHSKILRKAEQAIWDQSIDKREFNSTVLAIRSKDIKSIKHRIRAFHNELEREFGNADYPDQVYALNSCFFKLFKGENQ